MKTPEDFILRFADRTLGRAEVPDVLDVACGTGRHALFFARNGCRVIAMERSVEALARLADYVQSEQLPVSVVRADVERMSLLAESCDAIIHTSFLFRPLAAQYRSALKPGGILYFRTFTREHREVLGHRHPRADFLLESGELQRTFSGLEVIHYEEGIAGERAVATLVAAKPVPPEPS